MTDIKELERDAEKRIEMLLEKYRGYEYTHVIKKLSEIEASEFAKDYFSKNIDFPTGQEYFEIFFFPKKRKDKIRTFEVKIKLINPLWN